MAVVRPVGGGRTRRGLSLALPVLLIGLLAPALPVSGAPAQVAPTRGLITGWLPHWAVTDALAAVEQNTDLIAEASPFAYTARASKGSTTISASMSSADIARVVASMRARGIAVIPSVADGSAARAMAAVLKDPEARRAHVGQLVDLVMANEFDGIELDYEKFAFSDGRSTWEATRPAWVAFVTELGAELHAAGRSLALAVPPIYDGNRSSASGYWVYDYAGVAPAVDSLRIMTYDYSVSRPGPISPIPFLHKSLAHAVTVFPAERIRMGLPAYGRLWTARRADGSLSITGTCPTSGVPGTKSFTTDTALAYLTSVAGGTPALRYDEASGEMVATFRKKYTGKAKDGSTTSCTVDHEAWWVSATGVAARLPIIPQYGLAGIAAWHLGGVDSATWAALRGLPFTDPAIPPAPPAPPAPPEESPTQVAVAVPSRVARGEGVTVAATVSSAAGVPEGTPAKLRARTRGSRKWRTLAKAPIDASGRVEFAVPALKRTTYWRVKTPTGDGRLAGTGKGRTVVTYAVAVRASTLQPAAGQKVKLKVRLYPKRKRVVVKRQMLVDGRWKTLARKRSRSKGRVTFSIRWPTTPVSNTYRVVTKAKHGYGAGSSATFTITTR